MIMNSTPRWFQRLLGPVVWAPYEVRTALFAVRVEPSSSEPPRVELRLECHTCGRTTPAAATRPGGGDELLARFAAWVLRRAWDRVNTLPADYGVRWASEDTADAARERERDARRECRGALLLSRPMYAADARRPSAASRVPAAPALADMPHPASAPPSVLRAPPPGPQTRSEFSEV